MFGQSKKDKGAAYIDPSGGLSHRELQFSGWFVRHRLLLADIGKGALIVWCVATVGYSLWGWGKYLFIDYTNDQRLLAQSVELFQNYEALHPLYDATDVVIGDTQVFQSGGDRYDFVADVTNPNERHIARIRYAFLLPEGETKEQTAVVLPGQTRPLAILGSEGDTAPTGVRLALKQVAWQRLDPHRLPNVKAFQENRLQFRIENFSFTPRNARDGAPIPRVRFDIHNDSAYSYWTAVFYIELESAGKRAGIAYLPIDAFRAGEMRPIDIRLFGDQSGVNSIKLVPLINIFDPAVYLQPGK